MKKHILLLLAGSMLGATLSHAAARDEWTFQGDAQGTLLADSVNTGSEGSAFGAGGAGVLETDGLGSLLSTPSATNLYETGAAVSADLAYGSAASLYLRYDLDYDLTASNSVGTSVGISFVDAGGTNVTGLVIGYNPGVSGSPADATLVPVTESLAFSGTISAIAKVDPATSEITVWYDTTGGNAFVEGSPAITNQPISIASIAQLRILATGSASGAADDYVAVENIRVADNWSDITDAVAAKVTPKYLNEWLFDRDPAGRTLSEALNSGTDGALFEADTNLVTQTDGAGGLVLTNEAAGVGNLYTDGAILRADVADQAAGLRYLRYDFQYDLSNTNNNSGTLMGLSFADTSNTNLAGVVLKYGDPDGVTAPAGVDLVAVTNDLALTGSISVIAEVNLTNQTISVWYDLSGGDITNTTPDMTESIDLTTIEELEFRATGDLFATASNNCVRIDNIRTAATWDDIVAPLENLTALPDLSVTVNAPYGAIVGETNTVQVIITNTGGAATGVKSALTASFLFDIIDANTPVDLAKDASVTNTFGIVANPGAEGSYDLTATAFADGGIASDQATVSYYVGAHVSYQSHSIANDAGGVFSGVVEPGETFDLTLTSVNDGGAQLVNVTNSLMTSASFPSITPNSSNIYPSMGVGETGTTVYRILCATNAPSGTNTLTFVNSNADGAWTNEIQVVVGQQYLNLWNFDRDAAGLTLSGALNTGSDGAVFGPDAAKITQTDGAGGLICANEVDGIGDLYVEGANLRADVVDQSSGVRYLRYDVAYDLSARQNNTGTLLELAFSDATNTGLAGIALKYGDPSTVTPPADYNLGTITNNLALTGTISVIAEVDLDNHTLKAWYDMSGGNNFNAADNPNASIGSLSLTTVEELEFRATGDMIATDENDAVRIDSIRTAGSFDVIAAPIQDLSGAPELGVSVDVFPGMAVGDTKTIPVAVTNSGGLATGAYTTLTLDPDRGSDLSIVHADSTPFYLGPDGSTISYYDILANPGADGSYYLTAQAFADGGVSSDTVTFEIYVGSRVSYKTHSVANDEGGVLPGEIEPGETFDLTVTSWNDGGVALSNVVNSLINNSFFTVNSNKDSNVYASLAPTETGTTTYSVTVSPDAPNGMHPFSVVNTAASGSWTNEFLLDVVKEARLAPNDITILVAPGDTVSEPMVIVNNGNTPDSFTVTDDGRLPVLYTFTGLDPDLMDGASEARVSFYPADFQPETVLASWTDTMSDPTDIGFPFFVYGSEYDAFMVDQGGSITLTNTTGTNSATLTTFELTNNADTSTIRYMKESDRLVVAWNNNADGTATAPEMQAWLNADGSIEYLYEYGDWGAATMGVQDAQNVQTNAYAAGLRGQDTIVMTPNRWISYNPTSDTSGEYGDTNIVTFTADASQLSAGTAGTYEFYALINWDGNTTTGTVTVVLGEQSLVLGVPSEFSFSGLAGAISAPATFAVTNTGDASLSYTITDSGLRGAGYGVATADYGWREIPATGGTRLDAELDTTAIPIGFPFVYFGNTYTSVTVGVDGTLTLGEGETIVPFSAGLQMDDNAEVVYLVNTGDTEFTVNWRNMSQPGAGADQTFEAVLRRDGSIRFNYQTLDIGWTNGLVQLTGEASVMGSLTNDTTVTTQEVYVANTVYTTNTTFLDFSSVEATTTYETNYVVTYGDANLQALEFTPGQSKIVTYSPVSGTILAGETADITLRGDARSLSGGGTNDVDFVTDLTFNYGSTNTAVNVTFTATNSLDAAYADATVLASMWGADEPRVSWEQNANGTRSLSWPAPWDSLSRTYIVWYSTDVTVPLDQWEQIAVLDNATSYIDDDPTRNSNPVGFYRVTVQ